MRATFRLLVPLLVMVALAVTAASSFGSAGRSELTQNPCEFLDPGNPGAVSEQDTLFAKIIGKYHSGRAVVASSLGGGGSDYQDGLCTIDGGLTYSEPASDCGGSYPCSPLYGAYGFQTYPANLMSSALQTNYVDKFYPSRRHISGAGPAGTVACNHGTTTCVAWFTKGTKFVLVIASNLTEPKSSVISGTTYKNVVYGQNGSSNIRGTLESVADIAYDHISAWSTRTNPNGSTG